MCVERRGEVIVTDGALRRSRLALRLIALAPIFLAPFAACSRDIFDVDVNLASHSFNADFGAQGGSIPTIECDPAAPGACGNPPVVAVASAGDIPAAVSVSVGCDDASRRCYAQANASVAYELSVLSDGDFITKVERKATTFVRVVDITYTLPVNTLTFDVPSIDVYVGPSGSRVVTDPGVVLIDTITSIAAGQTITDDSRHLVLSDQSPARSLIETSIQAREPFTLIVQAAPRVQAGQPVPAGTFELVLSPKVRVGLPP